MPALIPALTALWFEAGVTGITTAYGLATLTAAVIEIGASLAINLAISKIAQALAGKPSNQNTSAIPSSRQITAKGTIEFRQLIYGQVRTGGMLVFFGTSGAQSRFLIGFLEAP